MVVCMTLTPEKIDEFDASLIAKGYNIKNLPTKDNDSIYYFGEIRLVLDVTDSKNNDYSVDVFIPNPEHNPNGKTSVYINGHREQYRTGNGWSEDTKEEQLLRADIQGIIDGLQ